MKNKIKQMSKLILAILFTFNTFIIGMGESFAAGLTSAEIKNTSDPVNYSNDNGSESNMTWTFRIDGTYNDKPFSSTAICITPDRDAPTKKTGSVTEIHDTLLKKVLYYGSNGSKEDEGIKHQFPSPNYKDDYRLLVTHVAAGIVYKEMSGSSYSSGNPTYGANTDLVNNAKAFINSVKKSDKADPDEYQKFYIIDTQEEGKQTLAFQYTAPIPNGKIKIKKSSNVNVSSNSNYSLKDAEYRMFSEAGCKGNAIGDIFKTNASGETAEFPIAPGTYYIKETKAPMGYNAENKCHEVSVTSNKTSTVNSTDDIKTGSVKLKKESFDPKFTNEHKDTYSLENAEFTVYKSSTLSDANKVGVLKTNANGESNTISNLPYGTYYAKETKAPKGFNALKEPLKVTIDESHPNGVFKAVDFLGNGILKIIKHSTTPTDRDLTGATFKVYESDCKTEVKNVPELVTDAKGDTQEVEIAAGKYCVRETKAPEGFTVNEEPVEILVLSTGEATVIDMYDDLIPENPKTGVATYFGITLIAVASSICGLKVLKKKRVFKKL